MIISKIFMGKNSISMKLIRISLRTASENDRKIAAEMEFERFEIFTSRSFLEERVLQWRKKNILHRLCSFFRGIYRSVLII